MKNILIALAATFAFSALPAAHAQDSLTQVQVGGHNMVTPAEFAEYANTYRLTNGQKVRFSQSGQRYFLQVDNSKRVRILPVTGQEFTTADGARIVFRDFGDEVGISNFEKLPMAQTLPANTMMMARR